MKKNNRNTEKGYKERSKNLFEYGLEEFENAHLKE